MFASVAERDSKKFRSNYFGSRPFVCNTLLRHVEFIVMLWLIISETFCIGTRNFKILCRVS